MVAGQSGDFVDTKETVLMSNFSLAILQKRREACRELPLKMSATLVRHCKLYRLILHIANCRAPRLR